MAVEFHKVLEMKVKKPVIIIGLPGTGLVGSVAAAHLVEKMNMPFAGYITSESFAPLAAIHNYTPLPAARVHYSSDKNLVVVLSEMTIPVASSQEFADKVFEFAKSLNSPYIVSLGGVSMKEGEDVVYVVGSDQKLTKTLLAKKGTKPIKEGATTGVTGVLLTKGVLENYPIVSILAEASQDYLDPKAAANALKVLSDFIGVGIDTVALDKEALELGKTIKENLIKSKVSKRMGGPKESPEGAMYG